MMSAAETSATPALRVELLITADFPDGRPLLPPCDYGVVWHVVRRGDGRTTWRRIFLEPHSGDRLAPDVGNFSNLDDRFPSRLTLHIFELDEAG